jgi:hypothetical protein
MIILSYLKKGENVIVGNQKGVIINVSPGLPTSYDILNERNKIISAYNYEVKLDIKKERKKKLNKILSKI